MKLIKKSTLFERAEVELSEEEYKAYVLGFYFGRIGVLPLGLLLR